MRRVIAKVLLAVALVGGVGATAMSPASAHDCESGSYETGDCLPDTTH